MVVGVVRPLTTVRTPRLESNTVGAMGTTRSSRPSRPGRKEARAGGRRLRGGDGWRVERAGARPARRLSSRLRAARARPGAPTTAGRPTLRDAVPAVTEGAPAHPGTVGPWARPGRGTRSRRAPQCDAATGGCHSVPTCARDCGRTATLFEVLVSS